MSTEKREADALDMVMTEVGRLIADTPEAWAAVAMGCLDQGGLSLGDQDAITAILRHAGIQPALTTDIARTRYRAGVVGGVW